MRDRLHAMIERLLPWFDPDERDRRDAHTAAISARAARASLTAHRVLTDYREADRIARPRPRR